MQRCGLSTAVFVLAACLPHAGAAPPDAPPTLGTGSRVIIATSAPAPAPPPAQPPAPGSRQVIASSVPQAPPVVPVQDDGLRLMPSGPAPQPGTPAPAAAPTGPSVVELTTFRPGAVPPAPAPPPPSAPAIADPPPAPPPAAPVPAEARGAGQTIALSLEEVGPPSHAVGQPFSYEIVVRNTGATPVAGVTMADDLPDHARHLKSEPPARVEGTRLEWDLGGLEPGAERRLRVEVWAGREGRFDDRATATGSVSHSLGTQIHRPQLALAMTGPERVTIGASVPFRLQVTNNGTGPATHVLVHDHLPAGLQHPHGEHVEAEVGTLAPGESKTLNLRATAVAGGRHLNEAVVTADGDQETPAAAAVLVDAPALALRKTGPQEVGLGRELDQRLEVINTGTVPAANVRLTDALPAGLDYLSASDGGAYAAAGRTVDWALGTLAPGQSRAVTLKVLARQPGDWVNQARALADWDLEAKAGAAVHVGGPPGGAGFQPAGPTGRQVENPPHGGRPQP